MGKMKAYGAALAIIGGGVAILGAIGWGPWSFMSIDEAKAAHEVLDEKCTDAIEAHEKVDAEKFRFIANTIANNQQELKDQRSEIRKQNQDINSKLWELVKRSRNAAKNP